MDLEIFFIFYTKMLALVVFIKYVYSVLFLVLFLYSLASSALLVAFYIFYLFCRSKKKLLRCLDLLNDFEFMWTMWKVKRYIESATNYWMKQYLLLGSWFIDFHLKKIFKCLNYIINTFMNSKIWARHNVCCSNNLSVKIYKKPCWPSRHISTHPYSHIIKPSIY